MKYQKTVRIWGCEMDYAEGEVVMLVERTSGGHSSFGLVKSQGGVKGNLQSIHRYHGWRGTSSGIGLYAHGARKIKKIVGTIQNVDGYPEEVFKVTVGPDLYPELD